MRPVVLCSSPMKKERTKERETDEFSAAYLFITFIKSVNPYVKYSLCQVLHLALEYQCFYFPYYVYLVSHVSLMIEAFGDKVCSAASDSSQGIMSDEPRKPVCHFWILTSRWSDHFPSLFIFTNSCGVSLEIVFWHFSILLSILPHCILLIQTASVIVAMWRNPCISLQSPLT